MRASSQIASLLRTPRGTFVRRGARPGGKIELTADEGDPRARRAREALSELDLEHVVRTRELGILRLADLSAGVTIADDVEAILDHLFSTYLGRRPLRHRLAAPIDALSSSIASRVMGSGRRHSAREQPPELLVLYAFENCPFCRPVRVALHELGLDHVVKVCPKGGRRRAELRDLAGREQVPFLVDGNTGQRLLESRDIVAYLERTYA